MCELSARCAYRLVEASAQVRLSDGKANRVGNALAERASRHLNTGEVILRVAGGPDA